MDTEEMVRVAAASMASSRESRDGSSKTMATSTDVSMTILAGETKLIVANDLVRATRIEDGQGGDSGAHRVNFLAIDWLRRLPHLILQGADHRFRNCDSHLRGQLFRQAVGHGILDVERLRPLHISIIRQSPGIYQSGMAQTVALRVLSTPICRPGPILKSVRKRIAAMWVLAAWLAPSALPLDPRKSLTQYSRTIWTQERGLPQDTIRAITQTKDGYLWLGTDEGLARFDGYEFVVYNKTNGDLPDNSITALAAANDGGLWIGTSNGLTQYREGRFRTFTVKQGLPDAAITGLLVDREGALWVVAGVYLSRYQKGQFTNFKPGSEIPVSSARAVCEDANHDLWVGGFSRVVRRTGGKFVTMLPAEVLDGMVVLTMMADRDGNIWIGGNRGIIRRSANGEIHKYGMRDGLPDPVVRALWADGDGNIWAGTSNGMARLQGERFATSGQDNPEDSDGVRCLFEDREGDLWVGANGGLSRWRNDIFMVYGKPEGLPSDAPNAVFQDPRGSVWVGFNDLGLMLFSG